MQELVKELAALLTAKKWQLVTAESCTGGGLAYYLTELAGSSNWFDRGFVTYSNSAKQMQLNVENALLEKFGAVSKEVAAAMATGALANSRANISAAITGIAGPDGGTAEKPVGLVYFGIAFENKVETFKQNFAGDRSSIRQQAIQFILQQLIHQQGLWS